MMTLFRRVFVVLLLWQCYRKSLPGLSDECTLCLKINRTPETFYYNFAKIVLISIKIGVHNLHMT